MIGKKIKIEKEYLEKDMGFAYRELDNIGDVYAIILDKFNDLFVWDKLQNCHHSSDLVYLTTDYYLIKILRSDYAPLNEKLNWHGNVWKIKPNKIKNIID